MRTRHLRSTMCLAAALASSGMLACGADTTAVAGGDVATVEVTPTSARLETGDHLTFNATVKDADGDELSGRRIFWDSEDSTVATVDDRGVVTAVAPGKSRIAASAEGKSALASVTVVPRAVGSVIVSPSAPRIEVGETVRLSAELRDADGHALGDRAVSWRSDRTTVATVDAKGTVHGVAPGSAVITATSEGKSGTATVTVAAVPVASVSVSPASATVSPEGEQQFTAVARSASGDVLSGRAVTWSSDHENVAVISSSGLAVGRNPGVAHVTATVEGKSATATLTVIVPKVASVTVTPASSTLGVGQNVQLAATVRDANGNTLAGHTVTWMTSNPLAATVSSTGLVRAVLPGSATITATSDGVSGTATVRVRATPPPKKEKSVGSVEVSPHRLNLKHKERRRLSVEVKDTDGATLDVDVEWSTSDARIATVSGTGEVTGVKKGKARITASAGGKSDGADVDVKK
ncbi:MAG TPA: Ig-like domain-containing protein [Gemmatimonadaceae bacterium]|nr:Ig-like domain-containing protein [Gemmatimonadaceae bacterium]